MPEGDTVWRTAHHLHQALAGAELTVTDFRVPKFATVSLVGETVEEVVARGKHIVLRTAAHVVHSHLKMEGAWHLYRPGTKWIRPDYQARAVLETSGWQAVGFDLGIVQVLPRDREHEAVGHLGPDLLGPDWDAEEAVRRLAAQPDAEVITALIEQRNLAGLGNEYVNELCFLRGYHPQRRVADCDLPATVALAHRLIHANRDRVERTTTGDTRQGRRKWVYGREGRPCLRCGTRIRFMKIGRNELELRNTFWCPRCQPAAAG
ncbi:MAG: DNA-formamidopyrimidine glycosylase family protein [Microbacteriaceae bacterium]